jgi:hypothetical protein
MDLLDLWRGRLSVRRLCVLIDGLPPQSALHRSIDAKDAAWSNTDHMLAHVIDELRINGWKLSGAPRSHPYEPFPRPGQKSQQEIGDEMIERRAKAFKERQRQREEASA